MTGFRRNLWTLVFLTQLAVSKLLPWLMPPPTFMMVQDAGWVALAGRGRGGWR
jgi:hypothetical protein